MNMQQEKVQALLNDFSATNPDLAQIVAALRQMVLEASSELEEGVKYGGLVYLNKGDLVIGVFLYKAHVTIEFSYGYQFNDSAQRLEGSGKYRRNLKFTQLEDIQSKQASYFIQQAIVSKKS